MKKCLKCNKDFDDDSLFCPECGEMLVSNDTCPNCHKEVKLGDKFCRHCGRKIERIRVCSECGKEVDDETVFCPKCGSKIPDDGFIRNSKSISRQSKSSSAEQKPLSSYITYAFTAIFGILAILLIVGMFGNIIKANTLGLSSEQSIKYFFGEGAKNLESIKESYKYKEYYTFTVIEFVLDNIFYFGGLVGLITSIVFTVINLVKACSLKEEIKHAPLYGMVISVLPYLFIIAYQNFANMNYMSITLSATFGWGTTMLVVAVLCLLFFILVHGCLSSSKNSKDVIASIIRELTPIAIASIVIFGMSLVLSYSNSSEGVTESYQINAAYYPRSVLMSFSSEAIDSFPSSAVTAIVGYFLLLLSSLLMISSLYLVGRKSNVASLAFFGLSYVIFIVASILCYSGAKELAKNMTMGPSAIATYILGVVVIAGLIGNLVLSKKQRA